MGTRRLLGLTLAASLVAGACGAAATATPTPASATATPGSGSTSPSPSSGGLPFAGQTVRIVHGGAPAFDDLAGVHWLQELKDKYGITVQYTETAGTDVSLRAVVSGAADIDTSATPTEAIDLVQQSNSDVKLIAAVTYASDDVVVTKTSIATVADLKGKTAAISAPGNASEMVFHLCLNALGFDYSTLKVIQVGGTEPRFAAVLAGQVDATSGHVADATLTIQKSNGALHQLVDCGKTVGNYPITGMFVAGSWLRANPQLAQALVDANIDSMRWATANKDAYIALAKTTLPDMDPSIMPSSYDYFKAVNFWPVNGGIDTASIETYLGYAAQAGVLTGKIPTADKWIDDTFVNNYLQRNGSQ